MRFDAGRRALLGTLVAAVLLLVPAAVASAELYYPFGELDGVATKVSIAGPVELVPETSYLRAIRTKRAAAIKVQVMGGCDNDQYAAGALKWVELSRFQSRYGLCNNDDPEHDVINRMSALASRRSRVHMMGVIMKRLQARIVQAVGCMKGKKAVFKGCPKYRLATEINIASLGARLNWRGPCKQGVSEITIHTPQDSAAPTAEVTPCRGEVKTWDLSTRVEPNDTTAVTDEEPLPDEGDVNLDEDLPLPDGPPEDLIPGPGGS